MLLFGFGAFPEFIHLFNLIWLFYSFNLILFFIFEPSDTFESHHIIHVAKVLQIYTGTTIV